MSPPTAWSHGYPNSLDIPCGECGGMTRATHGTREARHRKCAAGHRGLFDAAGAYVRSTARPAPDPLCAFPGCRRPRKRHHVGGRLGTRWCEGHTKQRERHGEDGMRPLLKPCGRKWTSEERAEQGRRVSEGMARRREAPPTEPR